MVSWKWADWSRTELKGGKAYVNTSELLQAREQQIADMNELIGIYGEFFGKLPEDVKKDFDYNRIEQQMKKIDEDMKFEPKVTPSSIPSSFDNPSLNSTL